MTKLRLVAVVLAVSLLSSGAGLSLRQVLAGKPAAQDQEKPPKPDAQEASQPRDDRTEIRGTWVTWVTVTRTINGKRSPPQQEKDTWVITDDKMMHVGEDGFLEEDWTFKLDPTQRPRAIDVTSRRTGTLSGIYQLGGDTLKICYSDEIGKRPTEFPAEPERMRVLKRVSRTFAPVAQRFANAPGCFWMIQPQSPSPFLATGGVGINYFYKKDPDGAALITMAYHTPDPESRAYRPVLLDAGGKRYLPKRLTGGYSGSRDGGVVALYQWRMDPALLLAEKVALMGIEALTPETHAIAAREALEQAKRAHLEVLPWPQLGEPYSFTLTSVNGRTIRSADLKGKVVVIDCWASWCSPCMALLPELKALYEKWHQDGLEIVGISLDRDVETVQKICKSQGLTWPQVLVPSDEKARELWQKATGIDGLPRVLIIDREGILRADQAYPLDQAVAKLLKRSSVKPK